jgi:hypothetical protein
MTDIVENTQEGTPPEYTEVEQRAMEMGWRPKTEFSGDENDFIDAKEFVSRKPLFDRIEHQSKQLKRVTQTLDALKTHYTKVQETEFNRALAALKQERKAALTDGDGDKFDKLDDEIKVVESQIHEVRQAAQVVTTNESPEVFQKWVSKNNWYTSTDSMRLYADKVGLDLHASGVPPEDVLVRVEQAVRKEFPHKFTNPNKELAPEVGNSRVPAGKRSGGEFQLSDQERQVMNTLIKSDPVRFTKEKYISDLKKIRGLE